ncbi:conserved hypothetical protein [Methanocaldococcus vulcanius M7]|uniref:Uncharacterized protein n=1 Tax=Methanocaldococcus vulcanius (strain ATCC 700851 / DSM 12094 / M7) TaxID=579137 RepID=C9REJ9_METVM|nr:hypothetical protein [Methanocaldococcus vulcanius]ACX72001.1 conserved hypothetical protein [Methanocaldococcus vulcanius M7]
MNVKLTSKTIIKKIIIIFIISAILLSLNFGERTIAKMGYSYTITGEITNTNPYSIFVAVPSNISFEEKTLPKPKDCLSATLDLVNQTSGVVYYSDIFNGKKGFWIPPFTTVKIRIYNYNKTTYDINIDNSQSDYDVVGPAVVDKVKVLDLNTLFKDAEDKGIKIGKFKMYVDGYVVKEDTDSISIIIPAPIIIKNYDEFYKIVGNGDADVWISSYNSWYEKQLERKGINPNNDNPLIPQDNGVLEPPDNFKIFDVPAMAFTTSSFHPIDFYYIVYKYESDGNEQ